VDPTLLVALLIGLSSSLHCFGMCGAISGALSMSLLPEIRSAPARLLLFNAAFSVGRVSSYGLAGALVGSLGEALLGRLGLGPGMNILRLVFALLVIAVGLYVAGWVPRLAAVERIGAPLWRRLEPFGRRLIPVRSLHGALLYGLVWGWLPCGMVYWALAISASAGSAVDSGLFMLVFGLATLPSMVATGMLTGAIQQLRRLTYANQVAGILLILLGLAGIFYAVEIEQLLRPFR